MILVTGGTGLVGSHLLMQLINEGKSVRAIFRDEKSIEKVKQVFTWNNLSPNLVDEKIEWVESDILNPEDFKNCFEGIRQVYHCAAMVSFNKRDKKELFKTNINGTANLVNLCMDFKIEKLCYVSSTAAVGKAPKDGIRTEDCQWQDDGVSNYSVSKHLSEMEVWRGIEEGLNAVIVNPSVIIGPGDWNVSSSNLFLKVWKGLKFYSQGGNAFVDVRDVVSCMCNLMNSDITSERFLIVSENLSFRSLFDQIATVLNKPLPNIKAKQWMVDVLWKIEAVKSFIFGSLPLVTKESAESAMTVATYSNQKIKDALNMEFIPTADAIKYTGAIFLQNK
jgi:nucleoside-diphosphate-sugar epimerase